MFGHISRLCTLVLVCSLSPISAQAENRVLVEIDRAQIMRLDEAAGSIIIGNPAIADAAVQDVRTLVLTGKSVGSTNIIVLDVDGKEVLNRIVEVMPAANAAMTMYKGPTRQSYACSPVCEPTLKAGDEKSFFESVLASSEAKAAQSAPK